MKALQQIWLKDCQVTAVNLHEMPSLISLVLVGSTVKTLNLVDLPELERVRADDTPLSTLARLEGLPKLKVITLSSTLMTDVTLLGNIPSIDSIDLDNTPVSDISAFSALPNLKHFYIHNTRVVNFPPELADRGLFVTYSRFTLRTLTGKTMHVCGFSSSSISYWATRFLDVENKLPQSERLFPAADGLRLVSGDGSVIADTAQLGDLNGTTVNVVPTRRHD